MMIDLALDAKRKEGMAAVDSIYQTGVLPALPAHSDNPVAAMLGGVPIGGLISSQMRTLYTTAVSRYPEAQPDRALPER